MKTLSEIIYEKLGAEARVGIRESLCGFAYELVYHEGSWDLDWEGSVDAIMDEVRMAQREDMWDDMWYEIS